MRALDRQLLRDLHRLKMQALAIAFVVAAGTTLFVGTAMTSRSLILSEHRYYDDQRFAHVWSGLAQAPQSVVEQVAAIAGVAAVDGRLVTQGVLDLPRVDEPVNGLFIGIPPQSGHALNDVYVRRGRHVEESGSDEVLVSEAFADTNGLNPGDVVRGTIAGHQVALRIVGVALSPEFVMQIPPGGLVPDSRRFGVFWLVRDRLADLMDRRGTVNDIALKVSSDADEGSVISAVDRILEPYGGQGAYGRSSQPSHVMLEAHIKPVTALAIVVPSIFLAVAVFLTNVVLSRLVATERVEIGMMKAFGYGNGALVRHYLWLVLAIVSGGIILGLPAGVWLGRVMSTWFGTFFRFPVLVFRIEPLIIAVGAIVMLGASASGALSTLWTVLRMPPVIAMAPPAPTYRPRIIDHMERVVPWLSPSARMILRSISRRPLRAVLTIAGMSLAIAIVIFGGFTADALARVVDVRFERQERQDLSVVLAHARALDESTSISELPGVRLAEPYRAVAARLLVRGGAQNATLIGLEPTSRLRRLVDMRYQTMSVPSAGVIISSWLGTQAGIRRGETVTFEIREGRRRTVSIRVVGLIDEPLGTNAYMELRALGRVLDEPDRFSAANVTVNPSKQHELFVALKRAPQVVGVDFRTASLANFRAMGDESVAFIRRIEIVFAVIIAFGVVYNTARIALAEREYELATLRVLGFTRGEISAILLGEVALLAAFAIPLGCVVGYVFSAWLSSALSTELFRFPLVLQPATYAFAIGVFAVAAGGSALVVRRRLDRLDLVAVLKARE